MRETIKYSIIYIAFKISDQTCTGSEIHRGYLDFKSDSILYIILVFYMGNILYFSTIYTGTVGIWQKKYCGIL